MATTIIKKYSNAPYYDDFDETKNFHRILFRPGYSVQARELTQVQTLLQAQIDRFGQYNFKDGSRVVNGKATVNVEYDFVKIESAFTHSVGGTLNSDTYLNNLVGTTITGATSGVRAKVLQVVAAEGSDPNTLYVKYIDSGTNNTAQVFSGAEELSNDGSPVLYAKVKPTADVPTGQGSSVNIEEGVYFIAGNFVFVPAGTLVLDKYTNTPNYIVGLKVTEEVIDSATDTSLLDNAQGVPNTAAPGATRYKIGTQLVKGPLELGSRTEASFITLLVITEGKTAVDKTDKTLGTELDDRLARRTFEESGDYTVEPFVVNVKEYFNNGTNNGFKTAAEIVADGDAANTSAAETYGKDRLVVSIEPGVAYVKGYRIQNFAAKQIVVVKPRGADATNAENGAQKTLNVGNYVRVKEASMQGVPDVNDFTTINLYSVTIAQGQSSGVIGTARVRNILDDATSGVKRLYLFDIQMSGGSSFSSVQSVKQTTGIAGEIQFRADIQGTAQLFDVGNNGLVFKLPYNAIKSTRSIGNPAQSDIVYEVKQKFIADGSSGTATITIAVGAGAFTDFNNAFVFANVGGTPQTVQIGSNTNYYSLIDNNRTVQLNINTIFGGTSSDVQLIATVQKSGILEKTKSVNGGAASGTVNVSGSLTNGELSLGKADIKKLISVLDSNGTNITDRFTLDNGQRDNFYDVGKIILKPGFSASGTLTATFDYYSHGAGDYFTVDSYPQEDYDTIYGFNSLQGPVNLRDCIDFRPRRNDAGTQFDGTGSSSPQAPATGQVLATDIEYYMPRIDKLLITRRGEYKTEIGVPDENPKAPKTPDDAMGIYNLRLSPYVFGVGDVKPEILDNRRYTMRDIGDLDKRIKNLEYYTSLSLLEQSAADVELFDGNGFSRLKNGFIVDGFHGHNVGDPSNVDYSASVDKQRGLLRPKFDERNVNLIRKAGDVGAGSSIVNNAGIVTLPFTEVNYVNQPYASTAINVNPYNVFSWGGTVELSPDSDEWKETDVRPTILIDDSSSYDQFAQLAEESGILGTVWNEWETNWTGVEVDTLRSGTAAAARDDDVWWTVGEVPGDIDAFPQGRRGNLGLTTTTTTTTTQNQSRSGLRTDIAFDTVTRSNGTRVAEVNFIPFIRSRKVYFKAQLMKPNTRVYAFFDGVDVSSFVREESFLEFSGRTGVRTYENQTVHPDGSSNLVTDSAGVVEGSFVIPRNAALKFATGVREFRLTDDSSNNKNNETTFAEAAYHAQGLKESIEETVVSTKVPRLVQSELNQDRTLVDTNVSQTTTWIDPVAETILIDKEGGLFVKSADIYFKTKDANIPVRLTIRTTENGIPTQKIVPGADKILYPSSVNTSTDSTAATNFAFDYPVYLAQDQEYAIVLTSQSDGYEVFIAEMGGFDLANTTFRIIKQPYGGVFFTSQNASTWTPEQSKDLKFKLNRCQFTINGSSSARSINFSNDELPFKDLINNPLNTTSGSGVITITHKNHGMYDPLSRVVIEGAVDTNGIAAGNINGTHTIQNITHDSYTITAANSDTAGVTGAGGGTAVRVSENRHVDLMYPAISEIQVPGTSASYFATVRSSQSVDGTEAAYQVSDEFQLLPNKNYTFTSPKMIGSNIQETTHMGGNKSFNLRAVLSSTSDFLSPVIDMTNLSVHTIQNIIGSTSSAATGEEVARGGTELARYITKKVELNEEADIATVYLNVNRPGASNVYLYYRTLPGGSGLNIEDVDFIRALPVDGDIPINEKGFEEVKYEIDPTGTYGTIQFKIVMTSTNSSSVPRVKDLRAICAT